MIDKGTRDHANFDERPFIHPERLWSREMKGIPDEETECAKTLNGVL